MSIKMDYLVTGYGRGMSRSGIEFCKVKAKSEEDALSKIYKSIWYDYHATEFNQLKYDELRDDIHNREIVSN